MEVIFSLTLVKFHVEYLAKLRGNIHTNPSRKRSFSKTLFKPKKFENAAFSFFGVDGEHFENEAFRIVSVTTTFDFPDLVFIKHKFKMTSD